MLASCSPCCRPRGTIVPVFDVQQRLGGSALEATRFSVIIVVNIGVRQVGLLVDAVNDVVELAAGAIEPPPDVGTASFVQGLGHHGEQLLIMLQLPSLVA